MENAQYYSREVVLMIDLNALDRKCPKCSGLGRTENPAWLQFWAMHPGPNEWSRDLDAQELRTIAKHEDHNQPVEPMFFICRECHGKGKILTDEGKRLIDFVKFWINPNY